MFGFLAKAVEKKHFKLELRCSVGDGGTVEKLDQEMSVRPPLAARDGADTSISIN